MRGRQAHRELVKRLEEQWSRERWVDPVLAAEAESLARGYRSRTLGCHWLAEVHVVAVLGDLRAERVGEALRRGRELQRLAWRLPGTPLRVRAHLRSRRVERLVGSLERAVMLEREHALLWDTRFGLALEIEDTLERAALREALGRGDEALSLTSSLAAGALGHGLSSWMEDELRLELLRRRSRSPYHEAPSAADARTVHIPCPSSAAELALPAPPPLANGQAQRLHGLILRMLTATRLRTRLRDPEVLVQETRAALDQAPVTRLVLAVEAFLEASEPQLEETKELQRRVLHAGPFRLAGLVTCR